MKRKSRKPPPSESTRQPRPARPAGSYCRGELPLVVAILLLGVALRFAFLGRASVEHFDEGVYASNLWFDATSGGMYPLRYLYAPPLLPAVIEASLVVEQLSGLGAAAADLAVLLPNLAAGCLTMVLVWWAARAWFGPLPALATLVLASGSEFHALYSRTALTEATLLLWMILALLLFERGVTIGRLRLALLAGLATGLAWWTKYNGWLPLLIGIAAVGARAAWFPQARRQLRRDLLVWALMSVTAAAVWSPCLVSLQAVGGYATVAANHRGYLVGVAGWPGSLVDQWANLRHFDGWLSCLIPAAACLAVACAARREATNLDPSPSRWRALPLLPVIALASVSTAIAVWCGSAVVLAAFAVPGLIALIGRKPAAEPDGDHSAEDAHAHWSPRPVANSLAAWIVAMWFTGLFVLTPLYWPYPRLTLPWVASTWFAGGLGIVLSYNWLAGASSRRSAGPAGWRVSLGVVSALAVGAIVAGASRVGDRGVTAWQDRTGIARAAAEIADRVSGEQAVVFVYAEPALFFHLRALGVAAAPAPDVDAPPGGLPPHVTVYLATALHGARSDAFRRALAARPTRLESELVISYHPSELVLLNNQRGGQLATAEASRAAQVGFYRWR